MHRAKVTEKSKVIGEVSVCAIPISSRIKQNYLRSWCRVPVLLLLRVHML